MNEWEAMDEDDWLINAWNRHGVKKFDTNPYDGGIKAKSYVDKMYELGLDGVVKVAKTILEERNES